MTPNKLLIFVTSLAIMAFCNSVRAETPDFLNIEEVLKEQHNWKPKEIGPIGLSYMIDVNASGEAVLSLHPSILQKIGRNRETPICSIFTRGRHLVLSSKAFENYNDEDAYKARQTWIVKGDAAMSEKMFLLVDKLSWFTYLREGLGTDLPISSLKKYFDKLMVIKKCNRTQTTVTLDHKEIVFPNLILTMPNFVYLSSKFHREKTKGSSINDNLAELSKMAANAGEQMGKGFAWILQNKLLSRQELMVLHGKMFEGQVDGEYLIMMGTICEVGGAETCGNLLLGASEFGDPNQYFKMVKMMLNAKRNN